MDTSPQHKSSPSQPAAAAPSEKQDPLWLQDPWSKKPAKVSQARWEDLILQSPIPFQGTDGSPMTQTDRLQVSQARAGVILTTKQHASELCKAADKLDLALLLPTVDGSKPANIYQSVEGPYEITAEDPTSKTAYKRLALVLVAKGKVSYKLPAPKLKLQTAAIAELVLEFDSRLLPKAEFEKLKEHPLQSFRQQIMTLHPILENALTFYGLRTSRHPGAAKQDQQLQCMLKAPYSARTSLLETSGQTALLTRDFIEHTKEPGDTTVLPRFWDVTQQAFAEMRITTKGIQGAAGLVVTRRGLALRIWTKHIAEARRALLPSDSRLTDENRHVVPRLTFQTSGWPAGTDPSSVVKSMLEATGVATVPTRTFRAAGVRTWILTSETLPSITRFTVDADGATCEILLQQITSGNNAAKGQAKGKQKPRAAKSHPTSTTSWSPHATLAQAPQQDDERLGKLEARFDILEKRQCSFENRVESKFDHIADSLRQILAANHTRGRETSGETPPPKHPKQS